MLARSRRFALGLTLVALVALVLGLVCLVMYYKASAEPARPSFDGTVAVVTNAQDDQVEMIVTEVSDAGEAPGSLLQVQVNVYPGRRCRARWRRCLRDLRERDGVQVAVGLSGGATTGEGRTPRDGPLAAESNDRRQLSTIGFAQPFFASQTSWPSDRTSGQGDGEVVYDGEVVFGKIASNCPNDVCTVLVTVPMSRSMVDDVGALWTLSTPRLGAEVIDSDFPWLRETTIYTSKDSPVSEKLDRLNFDEHWYLPEEPRVTFEASSQRVGESVQQSGNSPVEALGSVWKGSEPFAVNAVFERPHLMAWQDRTKFGAGILLPLAITLFVWAAKIARRSVKVGARPES